MNKSIRTLAMLGLAGGLALAGSVRADDAATDTSTASGGSQQDDVQQLKASLSDLTAKVNSMQSGWMNLIQVHGFEETDLYNDTTQSFLGNNSEVVGNQPVKQYIVNSTGGNAKQQSNGTTQMSVRNSRIDFLAQKQMGDFATKGYVEFDLLGYDAAPNYANNLSSSTGGAAVPNSEAAFFTNPTLRVRHAYLQAQGDGWDFQAGQYWTLLGWNMDYTLATVSVAPIMGVLYQRTPQLRVGYNLGSDASFKTQLYADLERPSERESDNVNYSQGVRFLLGSWNGAFNTPTGAVKSMPASLGISSSEREFKWDGSTTIGNMSYDTWGKAIALDALAPIVPFDGKSWSLVATSEWSAGSGYGDEFPSWNPGNGFGGTNNNGNLSAATGNPDIDSGLAFLDKRYGAGQGGNGQFTLIEDSSWNAQLQLHLPASIGTIFTAGYSFIDTPNISDLEYTGTGVRGTAAVNGKTYNSDAGVFVNAMQDLGPIRLGIEYASFVTHYIAGANTAASPGQSDGEYARDNRLQFSTWYRF